jgi:c-di-GMP-binding flagellar brake protein YcgR
VEEQKEFRNQKEENDFGIVSSFFEIEDIIRGLQKTKSFVTVGVNDGWKMGSMILEVDGQNRQFIYDAGRRDQVDVLVSSPRVFFSCTLRGAGVRFCVRSAVVITFEGYPALCSPMPAALEYLQRRDHFRVTANRLFKATVKMPESEPLVLDIKDISISGVGLSSFTVQTGMLPLESVVDESLDFAELGRLEVALKIRTHRTIEMRGRSTHFYGCSFCNVLPQIEGKVQQLVFMLDQQNRENSRGRLR